MGDALPCPVCGHQPHWSPSQVRDAESIGCNWGTHCPADSFDFTTPYLPAAEAVAAWNDAVKAYMEERK